VSAVQASPAVSGSAASVPADPVRALQRALYRAAEADPGWRFHALRDKILRGNVLCRARAAVRRNNGAPGIDKITLAQVEEYGVRRPLDELASKLRERRYRPMAARRVLTPKPGLYEKRPLSIPPVLRPDRTGRCEDRARAGLRGGLPAKVAHGFTSAAVS